MRTYGEGQGRTRAELALAEVHVRAGNDAKEIARLAHQVIATRV